MLVDVAPYPELFGSPSSRPSTIHPDPTRSLLQQLCSILEVHETDAVEVFYLGRIADSPMFIPLQSVEHLCDLIKRLPGPAPGIAPVSIPGILPADGGMAPAFRRRGPCEAIQVSGKDVR